MAVQEKGLRILLDKAAELQERLYLARLPTSELVPVAVPSNSSLISSNEQVLAMFSKKNTEKSSSPAD